MTNTQTDTQSKNLIPSLSRVIKTFKKYNLIDTFITQRLRHRHGAIIISKYSKITIDKRGHFNLQQSAHGLVHILGYSYDFFSFVVNDYFTHGWSRPVILKENTPSRVVRGGRSLAGIRRRIPTPVASKWSPDSYHPTSGCFPFILYLE